MRPSVGTYQDWPFCQRCLDAIAEDNKRKGRDLELLPYHPGDERPFVADPERNQEPMNVAPIPPYEYPSVPGTRPTPGTPSPERTVPETPERSAVKPERDYVPVREHSPTPTRTQPFLPARRNPVQSAPVILNHPVQTEQPLPHPRQTAPETQNPTQKSVTPVATNLSPVSKPNLPNRAQSDNLANNLVPTTNTKRQPQKPQPFVTTPLPERFTFVGRGVGRDRTFYEVIDLLTFTQKQGDFPDGTTDRMRKYYKRIYPEYFSASKRAAGKRNTNQQKADKLRAEHRPRRRKVKPVLHTA